MPQYIWCVIYSQWKCSFWVDTWYGRDTGVNICIYKLCVQHMCVGEKQMKVYLWINISEWSTPNQPCCCIQAQVLCSWPNDQKWWTHTAFSDLPRCLYTACRAKPVFYLTIAQSWWKGPVWSVHIYYYCFRSTQARAMHTSTRADGQTYSHMYTQTIATHTASLGTRTHTHRRTQPTLLPLSSLVQLLQSPPRALCRSNNHAFHLFPFLYISFVKAPYRPR